MRIYQQNSGLVRIGSIEKRKQNKTLVKRYQFGFTFLEAQCISKYSKTFKILLKKTKSWMKFSLFTIPTFYLTKFVFQAHYWIFGHFFWSTKEPTNPYIMPMFQWNNKQNITKLMSLKKRKNNMYINQSKFVIDFFFFVLLPSSHKPILLSTAIPFNGNQLTL